MKQMKTVSPNRSMAITLTQCDQFLHSQFKGRMLWGASCQEGQDGGISVKFVPPDDLHGWDSARVCTVADINRSIQAAGPSSARFDAAVDDEGLVLTAAGCVKDWKIAPGSAGRNLNLALSIEDCNLQFPGSATVHFDALTAIVQVNLSALPLENAEPEQMHSAELVSILTISGGEYRSLLDTALLRLALNDWCREHIDLLLSFLQKIDTLPAGQRRFACMESIAPGGGLVGVLSAEDPSRIPGLQSILPPEARDAIWINRNSKTGCRLLRTLPVFEKFPINGLEADEEGFCVSTPVLLPIVGENDIPLTVNSFSIRTQPCLQVEMDISVRLPSGITVHLTLHTEFETVLSSGSVRFHETRSTLNHYAEIPGGELTEEQQREISQTVKHLAACVGADSFRRQV